VPEARFAVSIEISPERPDSPVGSELITELDAHLAPQYPDESRHGLSVQQLLDQGVELFVIRVDGRPAGCGGVLFVGREYAELKRMYVRPEFRGLGLGRRLLDHLTDHARARDVPLLRLETGIHQAAAIALYEAAGFRRCPPFGPYRDDPLSPCYEKSIPA
jgi:putative acetyltransferase